MPGRIYLLNDSEIVAMNEEPYDSEKILQELLARYPDLLAGDQLDIEDPRRWILVGREMGIPGDEEGPNRWSVDHLFLDQDGIPTLIEVKRSSDTRIRREVVGQMLDYAANAVVHWPIEEIRATFERRCEAMETDPEEEVADLLEDDREAADFWQDVKINLQAGRIRILFVADTIPPELRRIVEFLNGQMDPAQVLAIEVKQFRGKDLRTLVPRLIGQTESARQKKGSKPARAKSISQDEFLRLFESERPASEHVLPRRLLAWASNAGFATEFGHGKRGASFFIEFEHRGKQFVPVVLNSRGHVRLQMKHLKNYPPFNDATMRNELYERLRKFEGLKLTAVGMEGRRVSTRMRHRRAEFTVSGHRSDLRAEG